MNEHNKMGEAKFFLAGMEESLHERETLRYFSSAPRRGYE